MSSNISKLYTLPEFLYSENCPVIISAGALYKLESADGKLLVQLKFKNIGKMAVKAVKVAFQTADVSGNIIDEAFENQYLDLSLGFHDEFSDRKGVELKNKTIRSFNAKITELVFNDGTVWQNNGDEFNQLPKPKPIESLLGIGLGGQYRREIGR